MNECEWVDLDHQIPLTATTVLHQKIQKHRRLWENSTGQQVSNVYRSTRQITDHSRDECFQAIAYNSTGTDIQTQKAKNKHKYTNTQVTSPSSKLRKRHKIFVETLAKTSSSYVTECISLFLTAINNTAQNSSDTLLCSRHSSLGGSEV